MNGAFFARAWAAFFAAWAAAVPCVRAAVEAPDTALVERETQLKASAEEKIQRDILDPILGKGRAMVFVDVELEQLIQKEETGQAGSGVQQRYKEKGPPGAGMGLGLGNSPEGDFILPGVPQPKFLSKLGKGGGATPEQAAQQQQAQVKEVSEQKVTVKTLIKKFQVTVIHDETVAPAKIELVRQRIVDAFGKYQVKPDQVNFRPTTFVSGWLDEFKSPRVYVPLTFAGLLLLFLLYLFGPLSWLLRGLVNALKEHGQTEVTVDSRMEGGQGQPGAMGLAALEGDLEAGKKKEEEEEEAMKKFEPFSYINEENLKRLAYLLRHEEPWISAVVLTYLKPEFAHAILAGLPLEIQARVAIETATIRQLSREQVEAIDSQIKEKVNFVLGGLEHLVQMIEDADEATRLNLLEYLKNEKPEVYDKIRKAVLLFEDVPAFPDREVQAVIRALKTENMARALVGAHPDIVNKFLANMSTGASSLLREEMEYTKEITPGQVEEERRRIMQTVKTLEAEGKIRVRQPLTEFTLEGLEEDPGKRGGGISTPTAGARPALAAPGDPQALLAEAAAAYQAGRLEECLDKGTRAAAADPALWQTFAMLGAAAYALGRLDEAIAFYEKYYQQGRDPEVRRWLDAFKASIGR